MDSALIMDVKHHLIPEYRQNKNTIELLINSAIFTLNNPRCEDIFTPLPDTWLSKNINSIEEAKKRLNLILDVNVITHILSICITDEEFISRTNPDTYDFILFVIKSNRLIMISYES